jgi:hypothetical protein
MLDLRKGLKKQGLQVATEVPRAMEGFKTDVANSVSMIPAAVATYDDLLYVPPVDFLLSCIC